MSSAEDPEKLLDQVVNEMQEDLIKMRQASAQVCEAGVDSDDCGHSTANTHACMHHSVMINVGRNLASKLL